jgi:DNA-binding XRE family transcriptional regulator
VQLRLLFVCRTIKVEMKLHSAKPPNRLAVAERFIALRRTVGLSQSDLGELVGVCRQTVSEIENSRVMPHDSTWQRFAEYESKGDEPANQHLQAGYWADCLVEEEMTSKGDTFCA